MRILVHVVLHRKKVLIRTPHLICKMTHLTGSAPCCTEELADMIIINMCMSQLPKLLGLKLPVHPPEATSIQTNESIISQICIASECAAARIQNAWRQHPFKILRAFVLLSVAVSYLESQHLFKNKKRREIKNLLCVYSTVVRTSKKTLFFDQIVRFKFVRRPPGACTLASLSLTLIASTAQLSFIH